MTERKFDCHTHCIRCQRYIDEETVFLTFLTIGPEGSNKFEKTCSDCYEGKNPVVRDVWYGYGSGTHTEENIADPETGKPIPFSSKSEKWEAMKKAGVKEAGDSFHGAKSTFQGGRHN